MPTRTDAFSQAALMRGGDGGQAKARRVPNRLSLETPLGRYRGSSLSSTSAATARSGLPFPNPRSLTLAEELRPELWG